MTRFIWELFKLFVAMVSSLFALAGGFLAIAGPLSGLGSDKVLVRVGLCAGGIVLVFIGLAGLELSNKKGAKGGANAMIDALLRSF